MGAVSVYVILDAIDRLMRRTILPFGLGKEQASKPIELLPIRARPDSCSASDGTAFCRYPSELLPEHGGRVNVELSHPWVDFTRCGPRACDACPGTRHRDGTRDSAG